MAVTTCVTRWLSNKPLVGVLLFCAWTFNSAFALTGAQQSLIKLINSKPASVDLRSVGDVVIQLRRKVTDNPSDGSLRLRLGSYL
jgi:hypothetical protein